MRPTAVRIAGNKYLLWIIGTAVAAGGPWYGLGLTIPRLIILTAILSMVTSGLNLSWGYGGELALGQAAIYASGAYVTGYIACYHINDVVVTGALSMVAALLIGLGTGIPGLRLGGWTLAMISFFLVVLVPSVVNLFGQALGGASGLSGIPLPEIFGRPLGQDGYYIMVIVVASAWFLLFYNMVRGRFGVSLLVLRSSSTLASSLGIRPYQSKFAAYAVAAIPAGLAGMLFSYLDGFIAPTSFSLQLAIVIIAASIIGGPRSVFGVLLGSAILEILQFQVGQFQQWATVVYGVLLVAAGVLLSDGVTPYLTRGWRLLVRLARSCRAASDGSDAAEGLVPLSAAAGTLDMLEPVPSRPLIVTSVSKSFGGNAALADVSFSAEPGQITALIGPNGSGKTTMLNIISGFYRPDSGSVELGGARITGLSPYKVSRAGVGRTFQTPQIPEYVNVADAIESGRYAKAAIGPARSAFRTPRYRRIARQDRARVNSVAAALGLTPQLGQEASSLPLGTRRILELARVLVGERSALLLDEVASGLDEAEIEELIDAVRLMRDLGATVVLVEHNFELVRAIADKVVVLADGAVLAEGTPGEIASHPGVVQSYLGEGRNLAGTRMRIREDPQ
jgi:branched-chain amino acid transport system permease protein